MSGKQVLSGQVKSLDALTGMRFFAAFAVFIHHVSGKFGIGHLHWPLGAQAVSFFFVLSGFILTYVYHDRLQLSNVKKFYFTRWARIWPLHFVCLAISALMLGWAYWSRNPEINGKFIACFFLVQSWIPNTSWAFAINGVSWSISTEMFFYLMFPLFLIGGQKRFWYKYAGLLGLTAILLAGLTMLSSSSSLAHVDFYRMGHTNPLLRLPEFCTGIALGYIYLNRSKLSSRWLNRSRWLDSVVEIGCLSMIYGYQRLYQVYRIGPTIREADWGGPLLASWLGFTSGCLVFALLIYVFSRSRGVLSLFFSTRPIVFLGEVSFAFYMIHQIAIRIGMQISPFYSGLAPWTVAACIGAISLGFSIILYKLVEMPCKSALLSIYEGKFKKGVTIPAIATWKFATSGLCLVVALLIAIPVFALVNHKPNRAAVVSVDAIKRDTPPELQGIKFGRSLVLKGWQVEPKAGGLQINLAWQKTGEVKRARFIHVCDEDGKVVAHGPRESELFQQADLGEEFVDSFLLIDSAIQKGSSIGIGLHGTNGLGMAWINKGSRSLKERRLDLVTPGKFAELADQRQQRFGIRVSRANSVETNR